LEIDCIMYRRDLEPEPESHDPITVSPVGRSSMTSVRTTGMTFPTTC
jgi:hypothetical protein